MAQIPANKQLWSALVAQARAKFAKYPSIAASHWVHQQYVNHGGRFIDGNDAAEAQHQREHAKAVARRRGKDSDDKKKHGKKK